MRTWDSERGLPQNTVQAIVQGHRRFLWVGTQEGLARFDGLSFRVWNSYSDPALPARNVRVLLEDRKGRLWIGLRGGGLVRLDPDGSLHRNFIDVNPTVEVRSLENDGTGTLWIGTRGLGLFRLDPGETTAVHVDAVTGKMILALEIDRRGDLWVGTEGEGVWRIGDGAPVRITTADGLPADNVWEIYLDSRDRLWLGTFGGGLVRYENGRFTTLTTADGLSSNRITRILEDRDHNLWVGTYAGLNRITDGKIETLTTGNGFVDDIVGALAEDDEGNLWIGTGATGMIRFKDNPFTVFESGPDGIGGMPRVVLEEPGRGIWVGTTNGGLQLLRNGKVLHRPPGNGQPQTDVFSLHLAADGALWVGTYGAGLNRFHHGRHRRWTTEDGLPHNTVWAIGETPDGTIWAGTYGGGLAAFRENRWHTLTTADGLATNLVRSLFTDREGTLWIGTSGGLCSLSGAETDCLTPADGLTNPSVLAIHQSFDGTILVGTNGGGVNVLTTDGIRPVTTADGLFDDVIYSLIPDDRGWLWMSCNRGIFGVEEAELLRVARGEQSEVSCRVLGRWDGMGTDECNGGSQPAGWKASDGTLWFPTVAGVAALDPRKLPPLPGPPRVLISDLVLDGTNLPPGSVTVPPDARNLEIHFTAPDFSAPERLRFRYRLSDLEGDDTWTDIGKRRTIFFTHLPHGVHSLEIVAGHTNGPWGTQPTRLKIDVIPGFFQTPQFFVLAAIGLIALGFAAASYRTLTVKRRERFLAAQIDERTRKLLEVTRELEQANRRLEELSLIDSLTGIPNRRAFDRGLQQMWARGRREKKPVALLMIDVDHFKAFNDAHGHREGDRCLRRLAGVFRSAVRRSTDLLARYGGEEFAVLLPDTDAATATAIAETLRRRIEVEAIPHGADPATEIVTISIGAAAIIPRVGQNSEILCLTADAALYRAKGRGRNRVESGSPTPDETTPV